MKKQVKDENFLTFVQKASKRIEDKKKGNTEILFVPSLDCELKIRSLTTQEIMECMDISDETKSDDYGDDYMVYLGVIEPSLKEVAQELKTQGQIQEYTDVCGIFDLHERTSIAKEIMRISGVYAENRTVVVVEELKK